MDNFDDELMENEEEQSIETPSTSKEESEVTPEAGSTLDNFKGSISPKTGVVSKTFMKWLMRQWWFWAALAGFALFFIVILIFVGIDFDYIGVGEVKPEYYGFNCKEVYYAWEKEEYTEKHQDDKNYEEITDPAEVDLSLTERFDYKTYSIDDYIGGVVWTDNDRAGVLDNEIVYQAMSIAARTYLLYTLPEDNCVVLKDYNPQNFTELNGGEENYSEVMNGVTATSGKIIKRDGEVLEALYDTFTYTEKFREDEDGYDELGNYYMMNTNETGRQAIPASWVVENHVPTKKASSNTKLKSLSLYGAKYLLEKVHSQYDVYRVLEYYYGRDIEYFTIIMKDSNFSPNCSEFSLTTTTLTKDQFVSKVQNYNSNNSNWSKFQANAEAIYDIATNNGINPEMIVVRAIVEGFSPGGSTNNYWGIGCSNTNPQCKNYPSFEDGILGMASVLRGYSSFSALCQKYAYLGEYWYNPGSPSLGGCYYAPHIKDYMSGERYAEVQSICASSSCSKGGGAGCTPTNEEDREAYALYQGRHMLEFRQDIFGIQSNSCAGNFLTDGACILFAQADNQWKGHTLGFGPGKIGPYGCALTSLTIALTCTGQVTDTNFNPVVLNDALVANNGFTNDLIQWDNSALRKFVPTFHLAGDNSYGKNASISVKISALSNALSSGIGIVHVKNSAHMNGHFVVLKSIDTTNNTILVLDPAGGKNQTYSIDDTDRVLYYTY